ncbi:PAS domain-containing protein [Methylobacterium sp. yr668]|jgi:PAS domain S-box-containing protein|uniref:PAS domain-containing protein n=1 Tax=Methylobacterium sp. yr668 TaxID=1761801 RepID=UPI0008EEDA32|nr:PAS domain-containing protein [Methylobacterium sp. yr668]SFT28257.1 PAS domain S-box-containing protein [Methylobacterium sp. yr668]
MIFVTKADGGVSYVSPEWTAFTGQAAAKAVGHGWFACMHPEDREAAVTFLRSARDQQSEYSLRTRLRRANGSYAWVMIGAVPSYGPPDRTFLGYLGSVTEIAVSGSEPLSAYGTLSRFVPPPMSPTTPPGSALEAVADYLLIAHGLIEQDHAKEMLPVLRQALMVAGMLLARNMSSVDPGARAH